MAFLHASEQIERRADRRAGMLMALYANAHRKKGARSYDWEYFFPDNDDMPSETDEEGIIRMFQSMAKAQAGG